jgi:hypothetical protein
MKMMMIAAALAVAIGAAAGVANPAHAASQPDNKALAAGLSKYLVHHGDVCVGKFDWPIDVRPATPKPAAATPCSCRCCSNWDWPKLPAAR